MTATVKISQMILENVNNGMSVKEALNAVCGEGSFERLAGEIYDEMRG